MIEDSRLIRAAIGRMLTRAGHVVVAVGDGQEGLQAARDSKPDIILLDMMLPTLVGTSVLRMLKEDTETNAIPVVILSGLSQKNERKLLKDGAAAFLEKASIDLRGDGAHFVTALEALAANLTREQPGLELAMTAKCGA